MSFTCSGRLETDERTSFRSTHFPSRRIARTVPAELANNACPEVSAAATSTPLIELIGNCSRPLSFDSLEASAAAPLLISADSSSAPPPGRWRPFIRSRSIRILMLSETFRCISLRSFRTVSNSAVIAAFSSSLIDPSPSSRIACRVSPGTGSPGVTHSTDDFVVNSKIERPEPVAESSFADDFSIPPAA